MNRLKWIDNIKGIACLMVVMVHIGDMGIDIVLISNFIDSGARGVQLFFIISTYLCFLSYAKNRNKKFANWVFDKVMKIIPLYYTSLILNVLFYSYTSGTLSGVAGEISIINILVNIFFLNGLIPTLCNNIIGGEWYIGTLIILYIATPFLFKYITNMKKAILFSAKSFIACIVFTTLITYALPLSEDYINYINVFSLIACLPTISIGIILYYLFETPEYKSFNDLKVSTTLVCLGIVYCVFRMMIAPIDLLYYTYAIVFGVICVFTSKLNIRILNIFQIIGRYSFGIYLFHTFILNAIPKIQTSNTILDFLINYIITITLSFFMSFVITEAIKICDGKLKKNKAIMS